MAWTPLPGAKAEGESVSKQFAESTLLTAKDATKAKLWAAGPQADVLHIATHGYADPEVPEFSGLLLAGEGDEPYSVLTANEVYLWNLQARLVTLSACQTGLGKTVDGEACWVSPARSCTPARGTCCAACGRCRTRARRS